MFNFMILLGVYLGLSNAGSVEHQPLLGDLEAQGIEGYQGTVGVLDGNSNTQTRDTKWSKTRRDDIGRVTNRLESAGSLGKYLKGFTVSNLKSTLNRCTELKLFRLSFHIFGHTVASYKCELSL